MIMKMTIIMMMMMMTIKRCKSAYASEGHTVTEKQICAGGRWNKVLMMMMMIIRMTVMMMIMVILMMMIVMMTTSCNIRTPALVIAEAG